MNNPRPKLQPQPCAICETRPDLGTIRFGCFPYLPGRPYVCAPCRIKPENFPAIDAAASLAHNLGWFRK